MVDLSQEVAEPSPHVHPGFDWVASVLFELKTSSRWGQEGLRAGAWISLYNVVHILCFRAAACPCAGEYQDENRSTECKRCDFGTYQDTFAVLALSCLVGICGEPLASSSLQFVMCSHPPAAWLSVRNVDSWYTYLPIHACVFGYMLTCLPIYVYKCCVHSTYAWIM